MRPIAGSEAFQPRSRKSSLAEPLPGSSARSASPVTFFLRRGSQGNEASNSADAVPGQAAPSLQTLAIPLDHTTQFPSTGIAKNDMDDATQSPRRRSTLKAREPAISQGSPAGICHMQPLQQESLTPLLVPSDTSSLPSSPKSDSTRSLRPSDAESTTGDAGSQAILSSGDEEPERGLSSQLAEEAPQLIMPSIKIPSRRPFTERGKRIGNFKILVAGSKGLVRVPATCLFLLTVAGVGKTSLVKSIVQTCEDIVHVDPLPVGKIPIFRSSSKGKQVYKSSQSPTCEIHASTRPLPPWWSEIEESKILRRRRSMGDTVLDRNLCFVDSRSHDDCNKISEYMTLQLQKAVKAPAEANSDFASLLSGSGGSQVDLVFYMLSKGQNFL
jgi:hypothetical protein